MNCTLMVSVTYELQVQRAEHEFETIVIRTAEEYEGGNSEVIDKLQMAMVVIKKHVK